MKTGFQTIVWGPRVRRVEYMLDVIAAAGYQGVGLFQRPEVPRSSNGPASTPCGPERCDEGAVWKGPYGWKRQGRPRVERKTRHGDETMDDRPERPLPEGSTSKELDHGQEGTDKFKGAPRAARTG